MNIKTAELKNNLSRTLRRVRAGKVVTVFDRGTPIATLAPIVSSAQAQWRQQMEKLQARAAKLGILLTPPVAPPPPRVFEGVEPQLAPDGRSDLSTIKLVRGQRDY